MPAIVLIAAAVAVVWGTILALRGSLIAGCLGTIIATCCFGPNFLSFDVAGISLSIDRLLLAGLVVAWIVQWRVRQDRRPARDREQTTGRSGDVPHGRWQLQPLNVADGIVFAFVGVLALSMFTHDWRSTRPGETPIPQHLINGYLIPLALFWIARQTRLTERHITWILATLTVFGVYLAITGLLEIAGAWSFVFPRYIADPQLGLHFGRARGPMVHSVSYGLYLATCLIAVWLLRERFTWRWQVLLVASAMPLMMAAIFFTKTRSVWLGAGTALFVALACTLRGRVRTAVLGGMVAAALLVGVTKMDSIMGLKREGTVSDTRASADMRKSFAYTSWKMFQDRPLLGFGFGHYAQQKLPYLTDQSTDLRLEQIRQYAHHNTFLSVLTETGIVGFVLLLLLLGCWAKGAWRLARDEHSAPWAKQQGVLMLAVLGIAGWQMLAHEITFTPIDNSLIYFLAGITLGLLPLGAKAAKTSSNLPAAGWRWQTCE